MRNTLAALTLALALAAGVGLAFCQSAGAAPANGPAVQDAAITISPVQPAQYAERRARHGIVKCYRTLVIGPYRCHYFPGPF
jgi:hypothetical protein